MSVVRPFELHPLARRTFLRHTAWGLAAVPLIQLGCAEDAATAVDAGSDAATGAPDAVAATDSGAADASANADADSDATTDAGASDAGTVVAWATGGTAAMTAKASYPDPFTEPLAACALVATATLGPCTTATDLVREDVSEGNTGLPVRLALKVVDTACAPVVGVSVKIWHTNPGGSYSGDTPNNNMCLTNAAYATQDFFRGVQVTDADGVVTFDSCFPGWYRGRAIHIHFQVKSGNTTTRVSQLFFPEDTTQDIFASHPEYSGRGQPDTTFSNDNVFAAIPAAERPRHVLSVARMSDGAMLASKVVTVV